MEIKMPWLKKIVQVLEHVLPFILGVGPLFQSSGLPGSASPVVQKVIGDLNGIPQIIVTAEQMYSAIEGQNGPLKLKAAAPMIQQLIIQYAGANLPGSPKLKDPVKLAAAAAGIASNMADALNSFE
jgi:hypothetical protein